MTKLCINPGEYAGRAGEPLRQLDEPVGTCGNKLVTPGKGEELLYCKACRDEAVRCGEFGSLSGTNTVNSYGMIASVEQQDGWNFNKSSENESALKPLCQEVEKHFALPAQRLYRYFAVEDDAYLADLMGVHFRGFHIPLSGRHVLPEYLRDCFFQPFEQFDLSKTFEQMVVFDNLIYIRYDTCSDVVGCVITYAHELQHFMQHGHTSRLWAVNSALYGNLGAFEPKATAIDVPTEQEANVISKRVAETIFGGETVRKFAEEQISFMDKAGEPAQKTRWVFFRDVPSSTEYDLLAATLPFVQKYKGRIDFGVDVNQPDWWVGPV